jgi:Holliday junction resolvasome RuvABC DNA-binding subunit
MAGVITQLIKLAGSEEVKAQFKAMGDEGAKAFDKTRSAIGHLNKDMEVAGQSANKAGEAFFSSGAKASLAISGVLGLGIAVVKLANYYLDAAASASKFVSEQAAAAQRLGQSTKNYSEAIGAFRQIGFSAAEAEELVKKFGAGSAKAFNEGIAKLKERGITFTLTTEAGRRAASEFVGNLGSMTEIMKLSKAVFDTSKQTLEQNEQTWVKLADAILKIKDPAQQMQALMKAGFSEELARRFLAVLSGGGAALKKEFEDFRRLSGNLTKEQSENNEKIASSFERAVLRLSTAWRTFTQSGDLNAAAFFTPIINGMANALTLINEGLQSLSSSVSSTLSGIFSGTAAALTPAITSVLETIKGVIANGGIAATIRQQFPPDLFQQLVGYASAAWQAIQSGAQGLWSFLTSGWSSVTGAALAAFDGLVSGVATAFNSIWGAAKSLWDSIVALFSSPLPKPGDGPAPSVGQFASGGRVRGPGTSTSDSILARLSNGEFVMRAAAVRHYGPSLMAAINSMRFAGGGMVGALPRFATGGEAAQQQLLQKAVDAGVRAAQATNKEMKQHHKTISDILNGLLQAFTGGLGGIQISYGPAMAGGGSVRGPGTSTSDSILARLSRGEFVMRAAAVRHYGPGMMAALNGLQFPVPGLASGGLVGMAPSSGGRPLVLNFPSGAQFRGSVVDVMGTFEREALSLQNSSTGTKPSWVGGR